MNELMSIPYCILVLYYSIPGKELPLLSHVYSWVVMAGIFQNKGMA